MQRRPGRCPRAVGRLRDEIRDGRSRHAADSGAGAAVFSPAVVGSLGAAMHEPAAHLADWLPHPAGHVLGVGAGAAPWLAEAGFGSTTVRHTDGHPPISLITAEPR